MGETKMPGLAPVTIKQFQREYLRCLERKLRPSSVWGPRRALDMFMKVVGAGTTADFTTENVLKVRQWMMDRGLSSATIWNKLVELGTAFNHAMAAGYLETNPIHSVWPRVPVDYAPPQRDEAEIPGPEEVTRLLVHLRDGSAGSWEGQRLFAVVATLALAGPPGLHYGQAVGLKVDAIDLVAGVISLDPASTAEPERPMPPKLVEILAAWLPHSGCEWAFPGQKLRRFWNGGGRGRKPIDQLKAAGLDVGIEGLTFELLRQYRNSWPDDIELGPEFLNVPTPTPTHAGPDPGRPGVEPGTPMPVLVLPHDDRTMAPIIRGVRLPRRVPDRLWDILWAMKEGGCLEGAKLTEAEIEAGTAMAPGGKERGHPALALRKWARIEPWGTVLDLPGKHRKKKYETGYGFKIS
jgi:integrase